MNKLKELLLIVFACLAFLLLTEPVRALEMKMDRGTLHLTGEIVESDYNKFKNIFRSIEIKEVVLTSGGGDVSTAMKIGRLISRKDIKTTIKDECSSACGLIWFAGNELTMLPGGKLGIHCARVNVSSTCLDREHEASWGIYFYIKYKTNKNVATQYMKYTNKVEMTYVDYDTVKDWYFN